MIKYIGVGAIGLFIGYLAGLKAQNTYLDQKKRTLINLKRVIKQRNNQMVENFAQMYSMSDHNENEFTEIDALLATMWMD